jgi:hypothetical protein
MQIEATFWLWRYAMSKTICGHTFELWFAETNFFARFNPCRLKLKATYITYTHAFLKK